MADLAQLLAQLLGQREEERPNLNPQAPSTIPGTRGLFARRPVQGRPALGYGDVAPMPPQWAERGAQTIQAPPQEMNPFPFPMGGPQAPQVPVAPMPQAARVGISDQNSPASFGNFADYANATMGLQRPQEAAQPVAPWQMALDVPETDRYRPLQRGEAAPQRGLEPPSAPMQREPAPFSMEDESWQEAKRRTHEQVMAERRQRRMEMPRPGRPLIAQAWANNTGSLMGAFAGIRSQQSRQAPIDMNRPILNNNDGSFSTERTITIEADGRQYLIPTIVGGRQRTEDEAIQLWRSGQNPEVGTFNSAEEAERAAQARSARIGQVRGRH
ncbi:MAG: hypothetical protein ABL932_11100 [Terricaulis sp.]